MLKGNSWVDSRIQQQAASGFIQLDLEALHYPPLELRKMEFLMHKSHGFLPQKSAIASLRLYEFIA